MISNWGLLLVSLAYVGGLFALAWWGDRSRLYPTNSRLRAPIYSLALAVYCSSWTFYGAVGTAVVGGLSYLPIYLGPILFFALAMPFFERLVSIAKQQNATSISDLLSARFGRSRRIAVLVTVIALTAAIPYIALQLKAVDLSIDTLTGRPHSAASLGPWYQDTALIVALLLAWFAALFGTREVDATEHHPGLVLAVAAESVVKLVALLAVGVFAFIQLGGIQPTVTAALEMPGHVQHSMTFLTQTLLSFAAIFCLPRQFLIGVVECAQPADLPRARRWFSSYLVLVSLIVIPIAAAGWASSASGASAGVSPDAFVLWLPMSANQNWLALLASIGGFSAATGMVIVASVALATMVSNDLVLPALWRTRLLALGDHATASGAILWTRRIAIVVILLAAYAYLRIVPAAPSLAAIGLLAFAAVAQFAPALFACVYWSGASRTGVIGGLSIGFIVWLYTLLLPAVAMVGGELPAWIIEGPFGIQALAPQSLLGFEAPDILTHGVFWSLLANISALVGLSLRYPPTISDRLEAARYMTVTDIVAPGSAIPLPGAATIQDLRTVAQQLLGNDAAGRLFERYGKQLRRELVPGDSADMGLLQALERELAGALGASSARLVLKSALRGAGLRMEEVVALFDEASQRLRLNRELLEAMMENMSQGILVLDADLRLVAWNQKYLEMFLYPDGFVYVGRPVADLLRFNAQRGWCGPGDVGDHVESGLANLRSQVSYLSERYRDDGHVIEGRCQPLPDGGFVMTFSDITAYKDVEQELRNVNETLEQRVAERTEQLARATARAEQANLSKTRFVAAASHDLLQPLNAARLFNAALRARVDADASAGELAARVDRSLHAAEELLDALLDISRLDTGVIRAEPVHFSAATLLYSLREQFEPLASQRGIELVVHASKLQVHSDPRMLKRILQNFVVNALRYTRTGRVVIGCRPRNHGLEVEFQVLDTGPGIPVESQGAIFEEFRQLDHQSPWGEKGLGLGLSICERIARILDAKLTLRSDPGCGSAFGVCVSRSHRPIESVREPASLTRVPTQAVFAGLKVLCIDDDADILDGMRELLARWHIQAVCVSSYEEALERVEGTDVVLADYHLHGRPVGLDLLDALCVGAEGKAACRAGALVTADASEALALDARRRGFDLLRKPVKPAALRALIAELARRVSTAGSAPVNRRSTVN